MRGAFSGTQRDALAAVDLVREKQGAAIDGRLASCALLVQGLQAAAASAAAMAASAIASVISPSNSAPASLVLPCAHHLCTVSNASYLAASFSTFPMSPSACAAAGQSV